MRQVVAAAGLLLPAAAAAAGLVPMEDLSEAEVAQMLRTWAVENSFGALFRTHQIDGLALSLLDLDAVAGSDAATTPTMACDTGSWLVPSNAATNPPPLMWKKLCTLLRRAAKAGGVLVEAISSPRERATFGHHDNDDEDGTRAGRTARRSLSSLLPNADT